MFVKLHHKSQLSYFHVNTDVLYVCVGRRWSWLMQHSSSTGRRARGTSVAPARRSAGRRRSCQWRACVRNLSRAVKASTVYNCTYHLNAIFVASFYVFCYNMKYSCSMLTVKKLFWSDS